MSTKVSKSVARMVGFLLLTLPVVGCNVSGTGLGKQPDAANDSRQTPEALPDANPEVRPLLPDIDADVAPDVASDRGPESLPGVAGDSATLDAANAGPDRMPSAEVASAPTDVAPGDTDQVADVPIAFEVQTPPDISTPPLVSDGSAEPLPLPVDGADSHTMVPLDGPATETAPADATPPDLAPADQAPDLPTVPDLPAPDLAPADVAPQPTVNWFVDNTTNIGGFTPTVMGAPAVTAMDAGTAVCFDGTQDSLLLGTNPIQGMQRFTIETLVYPEFTGTDDPRLIHIGDPNGTGSRLVVQMRADAAGSWNAIVVFTAGVMSTTIENTTLTHPSNQWYWLAVTYDGQTARLYVNGVLEDSNALTFGPMPAGSTSLGARQNGQYFFPGCMREVEVFSSALPAAQLNKP